MNIALFSLPFRYNYGHHLQAYALTTVLERMGNRVTVIDYPFHKGIIWWRFPFSIAKRTISKIIKGKKGAIFYEFKQNREHDVMSTELARFRREHFSNIKEIQSFEKDIREGEFDAFVVGSDQVWRLGCFDWIFQTSMTNAYLDFARSWNVKRVAYAASFGHDTWAYDDALTTRCSELAQLFNGISVREATGAELCKKHLHVSATHVLDPTMLLTKEDYVRLANEHPNASSPGDMMVYILDRTPDAEAFVKHAANHLGLTPFAANSLVEDKDAPIEKRIQPPVEQWIRHFMDAKFVITDSFHGTVFCIIFNKSFVTIDNPNRGSARIESLLETFGLTDRIIRQYSNADFSQNSINWQDVNHTLASLRDLSIDFLRQSLS